MTDRIKFKVWRGKWLRGGDGRLLTVDGTRCCLGFLGQACGIPDAKMLQVGTPQDTESPAWPGAILGRDDEIYIDTRACDKIIEDNDDRDLDDATRESRLTALFAAQDIDVEFCDGDGT